MPTRKIFPIATQSGTTTITLGTGCRLLKVTGECDGKPTFDFVVNHTTFASSAVLINAKYVGTPNGKAVTLWKDWPQAATITTTPTALGHTLIQVVPGAGVNIVVYYITGVITA